MHLVSELLRGAPSAQSGQDAATRVVVGKRTPIVHLFVSDFSATGASAHNHTWIVGRGAAVKGMFGPMIDFRATLAGSRLIADVGLIVTPDAFVMFGPVIDFRATLAGSRLIADVGLIVTPDAFFMNAKKALELAE